MEQSWLMSDVIDQHGYRANVGIILTDGQGRVFWARRAGHDSWQFPQGGLDPHETPEQAMYRELNEEVGLSPEHVEFVDVTKNWIRYRLPKRLVRWNKQPLCIGQKQMWFLLRLTAEGARYVRFDTTDKPEFDDWKWVEPWEPIRDVVFFKQDVYRKAIRELAPSIFPSDIPDSMSRYLRPKGVRSPFKRAR